MDLLSYASLNVYMNETNEAQVYKNFLICNKLNIQKMYNEINWKNNRNISIIDVLNKTMNQDQ
jgi:hypothetical protein